jgi:hypothetical protein
MRKLLVVLRIFGSCASCRLTIFLTNFFLNLSMVTYQVDILNPKADRLLKDLADMNLIAIKQTNSDGFMEVIERLRSKAEQLGPPTMEEITQEVETVRAERYARRKA